ncbi:hypothetical protein KY335_00895 [Candidatus Woesearchaeota archaeon]|nr:hypothetical protein [Candidatus Woesearchaeota archaeon]
MNFIKQIANKKTDSYTHNAFVRYGPGEFVKEDFIVKKIGKNIKIWGGFEWCNVLLKFVASFCSGVVSVNGTIPTTRDVGPELKKLGVDFEEKRRFGKKGSKYEIKTTLPADTVRKMINQVYDFYLMLDLKCGNYIVKMKKKETPKIGSPSDKFVSAVIPVDHLKAFIDEFLFDCGVSDFKSVVIKHTYKVEKIILDEKLAAKDPLAARLQAKRKGTVIRVIDIDGKEIKKEYPFEV